jgi:hypothetical protein
MLATCVLFVPPDLIARLVRDAGAIARVRGALTPVGGAIVPAPSAGQMGAAGSLLALAAAVSFITAVPLYAEPLRPSGDVGSALRALSLDQRWDMFSPNAARSDGWLLAPAVWADGTRTDLLTDGPDDRGERYSDPFYSRWTKVRERIASAFYAGYRSTYARYLCRKPDHLGPGHSPLVSFELIYVERTIQPPEKGPPLISTTTLWSQPC